MGYKKNILTIKSSCHFELKAYLNRLTVEYSEEEMEVCKIKFIAQNSMSNKCLLLPAHLFKACLDREHAFGSNSLMTHLLIGH